MNATLTETDREGGWRGIDEGGIVFRGTLQDWIKKYFHVKEDLTDFQRRNDYRGLELRSADHSRGYIFVGPLQLDEDFEGRMIKSRELYAYRLPNTNVLRSFTDFKKDLAGFSWRRE